MVCTNRGWDLLEFSAALDGHRIDYVESPSYDFLDARGTFVRQPRLAADGAVAAIKHADGTLEVIPVDCREWVGVSLEGRDASALAFDQAGLRSDRRKRDSAGS